MQKNYCNSINYRVPGLDLAYSGYRRPRGVYIVLNDITAILCNIKANVLDSMKRIRD